MNVAIDAPAAEMQQMGGASARRADVETNLYQTDVHAANLCLLEMIVVGPVT
jgi:hypothetical protein